MKATKNKGFERLRNQAVEKLKNQGTQSSDLQKKSIEKLMEELNVYQIELEMQNKELQESNQMLQKSERKYRELYNHAPVSYFTLNSTGNILEMNEAACTLIGLSHDQCRFASIFPFLTEQSKPRFTNFFKSIRLRKHLKIDNIAFRHASGNLIHGKVQANSFMDDPSGQVLYRLTVSDITMEKEALEELEKSEKRFKGIFEQATAGIAMALPSGIITEVNPKFCDIMGYSRNELLNLNVNQLTHPDDQQYGFTGVNQISDKKYVSAQFEKRYIHKKGHIIWANVSLNWINDSNSNVSYGIAVVEDITRRKKNEQILVNSEKELRELNAMKDKLFSIISHDLKNPMNTIINFSKLINRNFETYDQEKIKKFNRFIHDSAASIHVLLENLLIWSHNQRQKPTLKAEQINVHAICNHALQLFTSMASQKHLQLQNSISPESTCFADKEMISTVIRNLVGNAIKFTNNNGRIAINATQDDDVLVVSVSDTGVGMDSETLENLFHPGPSLSTEGTAGETGNGLGLLICKEFIEKNNGKLWVESEPGKGTIFYFSLPISSTENNE